MSDFLRATLETNLPKPGKKKSITLGVFDKNLAGSIKAVFPNLNCETAETSEVTGDLLRGTSIQTVHLSMRLIMD